MTKLAECTPGPWQYQEESDAYTHIVRGPHNYFITQLSQDTSGKSEANARLMALAWDHALLLSAIAQFKAVIYVKSVNCQPGPLMLGVNGWDAHQPIMLTPFGTPQLTPELRAALCRVVGMGGGK